MGFVGTKQANLKKAFEIYTKSFEMGDIAVGAYWLGTLYAKGNGVDKNLDKAIEYLTLASKAGNCHAD